MSKNKLTVKDYWWFHNTTCWKIKRAERVDFYFNLLTNKYLFCSITNKKWHGTKYHEAQITLTKEERRKTIKFENETDAIKWFTSEEE